MEDKGKTNKSANNNKIVIDKTKGIKVNAGVVAESFRQEIQHQVDQFRKEERSSGIDAPLLVGLLANDDPAARQYAEWTGRACRKDGLRYELRVLKDPIDMENAILDANDDPNVHGLIVYYPVFGQEGMSYSGSSRDDYLRDTVSYQKDVEGLCHLYRTNLYRNIRYVENSNNKKCLLPCTALSVVKILEAIPGVYDKTLPVKTQLRNKIVTIINRSEIVGRPLAAMLANDGTAAVYSIDIDSIYKLEGGGRVVMNVEGMSVEDCVRQSSIVITGVPTKDYRLPTNWIQPNTAVINVASYKNVDEVALLKIPGVVYVPQVGKVTVAMLERNLLRCFAQFHYDYYNNNPQQLQQQPKNQYYLQWYTAITVTAMLVLQWQALSRQK